MEMCYFPRGGRNRQERGEEGKKNRSQGKRTRGARFPKERARVYGGKKTIQVGKVRRGGRGATASEIFDSFENRPAGGKERWGEGFGGGGEKKNQEKEKASGVPKPEKKIPITEWSDTPNV